MTEIEKAWREDNRKKVKEFIDELGNVGKCIKLNALYEQLFSTDEETAWRYREYDRLKKYDLPYINRAFVAYPIEALEKKQKKLEMAIRCLVYVDTKKEGITPEMILRARDYPIDQILDYQGKGNMRCIAHEDKHPSMGIKNNRVRCFACGFVGDSIDVYMKLNGCNFPEAVKNLQ